MRIIKLIVLALLVILPAVGRAEREDSVATSSSQVMVNGRVATFGSVVASCDGDSVVAAQISRPLPAEGNYLPSWRVRLEEAFNLFGLRWAAPVISILLLAFLIAGGRNWKPWCVMAATLLVVEFVVRCLLSERVGLTGRSDCLLAVAMGIALILPLSGHKKTAVAGAVVMVALSVAGALIMPHPALRPMNPSLESGWLPIHVGLMIVAYSFFVIGALGALTALNVWKLRNILILGEVFLVCGIAAGSAWAAEAWGSWWNWDPKETFALVTAFIYLLLILLWDFFIGRKVAKTLAVCALGLVAATWFGISGLGGLHSYDSIPESPAIVESTSDVAVEEPAKEVIAPADTIKNKNIMKKNLEIPYLPALDTATIDQVAEILDEKGVRQTLDCVNWPETFPYKPLASFTTAHSKDYLLIDFTVKGYGVRAVNSANNSDVYQDSCVEFFVMPEGDDHYRNFEFNAIGTVHAAKRLDRHSGELMSDAMLSGIRRLSTLGEETFEEKPGMQTWSLMVAIPLKLMGVKYEPGKPVKLKGNFYKCGDAMSKPHFLSWSPIDTPEPDFHRPEFFGDITLL